MERPVASIVPGGGDVKAGGARQRVFDGGTGCPNER